jgi:riboflavin synthase
MFTGLIHDLGMIAETNPLRDEGLALKIIIEKPFLMKNLVLGESIAIDGVCLTVTSFDEAGFTVLVSPETITKTKGFHEGRAVNLERALQVGDRLGGHLVSGHVDGVGRVEAITTIGDFIDLRLAVPGDLVVFLAKKGSVAINGVSLTINNLDKQMLQLMLIPQTWQHTNFQFLEVGDAVNIEVDLIARYVVHCLQSGGKNPWKD